MSTDHRVSAKNRVDALIGILQPNPAFQPIIAECESLSRAIAAFHMEGIRFRMFNVDRLLNKGNLPVPPDALAAFADVRRELEAAGFHTRSHQAPPTASST